MRNRQSFNYDQNKKSSRRGTPSTPKAGLKNSSMTDFTIVVLIKKLYAGIQRLLVAFKYQFYKHTPDGNLKWSFPWFKAGLVGIVIFLFTQKDIQFSINMQAPAEGDLPTTERSADLGAQKMNVAQTVAFREQTVRTAAASADFERQDVEAYIERFRKVAKMEMKKFGIPASIKMAWGILESGAGKATAAVRDNNHFGRMMNGQPFTTSWENWRAHSLLISENYSNLLDSGSNYRDWIKELNRMSIPGQKKLGNQLSEIIEQYGLSDLDDAVL